MHLKYFLYLFCSVCVRQEKILRRGGEKVIHSFENLLLQINLYAV